MAAESQLEAKIKRWAKSRGIYCRKFTSPGHRAVPDRLFIKNGSVLFLEIKALGKKPTVLQSRELSILNGHGVAAFYVDSLEAAQAIITDFLLT